MEHTKPARSKKKRPQNITFEIVINGRTFSVNASPFTITNGEQFFRVSYNNGPVHVFGWDEGLNRYAETDAMADVMPPVIEMNIAEKLNECVSELQHAA